MRDFCCECGNTIDSCICKIEFRSDEQIFEEQRETIEQLELELSQAKEEIERYKKVLINCSPMKIVAYTELEEECYSCKAESENEHTDGCEYAKLIK